ncbi:MAG: hypothetical protein ABJX82_00545 [Paracoccaceae bacterium]
MAAVSWIDYCLKETTPWSVALLQIFGYFTERQRLVFSRSRRIKGGLTPSVSEYLGRTVHAFYEFFVPSGLPFLGMTRNRGKRVQTFVNKFYSCVPSLMGCGIV